MSKFFEIRNARYVAIGSMTSYPGACQMAEAYKRQTGQETFIIADDGYFYVVIKE